MDGKGEGHLWSRWIPRLHHVPGPIHPSISKSRKADRGDRLYWVGFPALLLCSLGRTKGGVLFLALDLGRSGDGRGGGEKKEHPNTLETTG